MSDAELRAGLSAALERPVLGGLRRRPWAYTSSAPLEELEVEGCPPLLFKDLGARVASRPGFVADPLREVEAYRTLLTGVDAPACHGSVVDGSRVWLFLERLDGFPLWQARGIAPWEAAARWLARLHAAPVPRNRRLLRHNTAHLERWLHRALALAPAGSLDGVETAAHTAIGRLEAWPDAFLHGELYPSNVLVQESAAGPRVRPVDWETAGVGPGVLDLAALTSGNWAPASRARVVEVYRQALGVAVDELAPALEAARLLVALQWLGWSEDWAPPREHAWDWGAEARSLAARIAP